MRRRALAACRLLALASLFAACYTGPRVPPGVLDVSGVWDGEWDGGFAGHGFIELTLTQTDTRVVGTLKINGAPAISATDGALEGHVIGDRFRFNQPVGAVDADLAVAGEEMRGQATGRLKIAMILHRRPR